MSYRRPTKAEGFERIVGLVTRYRVQASELSAPGSPYTETDARVGFIDGLLEALGWDVRNQAGLRQRLAEVVMERTGSDSDGPWGRPDYRLRVGGVDVMPVEAKKPSVRLATDASPAVQARSYGWSLSLPAAVLTNFHETVIFDATVEPLTSDDADVAAIPGCRFGFEEYVSRFDELWDRLSYESLASDGFERIYGYERPPRGESPFDRRFLGDFEEWRLALAGDIAQRNPGLGAAEVGRRTQRLLNALLFLRVCEDREIGRYEALLDSASSSAVVTAFREADRTFNAGLFTVLADTSVGDEVLLDVIREMYWPRTQYAFGVLRPDILAAIYEQYLAKRVRISSARTVELEEKPELTHAGGVVVTPGFVVDAVNDATLAPLIDNGVPADLSVLDLSCGSGVFVLDAFERILQAFESAAGTAPNLAERGRLAQQHVFAVDIDGAAVEVTKLSLLLAILGDAKIDVATARQALPDLDRNIVVGNAVVDVDFDRLMPEAARDASRRAAVAPLDLAAAFGSRFPRAGFSAVVGNPPYVRIQTMSQFAPDQLEYLQRSGYESPSAHNFDLYMVFMERALGLLSSSGRLGYVAPHRFTNHLSGSAVRRQLGRRLEQLVHFGEEQLFARRTTYVALVITGAVTPDPATFELVRDLDAWRNGVPGDLVSVERSALGASAWPISTNEQTELFQQLAQGRVARLCDEGWAKVFVGVQTSCDAVFFVRMLGDTGDPTLVRVVGADGGERLIERAILRPAVLDQAIGYFDGQPDPDRYAVFPYTIDTPPAGRRKRARLLTGDEMRSAYPHALAYLTQHEARLRARNISPDPGEWFWAYGRSQSLTALDEPKLIIRVLALSPLYALDENGLVAAGGGDGGPYCLLRPQPDCPYSIDVIQAILSHPAVDAFVASGKKYRGSYAVHRKEFLAQVPMPKLGAAEQGEIEWRASELRSVAVRLRDESDTEVLRSLKSRRLTLSADINDILTTAYGLDRALVERAVGGG